jgi:hypothetical protein
MLRPANDLIDLAHIPSFLLSERSGYHVDVNGVV